MTQVFFYHNAEDRIVAAAALLGKACRQGKAVQVFAPDDELAGALDRALWISPPTGFIPHVRGESPLAGETPIVIDGQTASAAQHERLLNLSDTLPPDFGRFARLIEVVGRSDAQRTQARERVKAYKDGGHSIQYFDLAEAGT